MDSDGGRLSFRYTTILLPICIFTFLITLDGYEVKRSKSQNDDSVFGNRKEKFLGKNFFLVRGKRLQQNSIFQWCGTVALPLSMGFLDFFKEEDSRSLAKKCIEIEIKVNLGFKEP